MKTSTVTSQATPNKSTRRVALASAAVIAASFVVGVPVSGAATPTTPDLATAKARCIRAVDHQVSALKKDTERVNAATLVDASAREAITKQFSEAQSGLTSLKSTINSASDAAQLRAACKKIVTDYRVKLLGGAKVRAVVATQRFERASAHAHRAEARFDKAISRAERRGVPASNITDARAHALDLEAKSADAHKQIDGLLETVTPLTAAQVNDGSAKPVLESAKSRLTAARADAKAARADVVAIRAALKVTK